MGQHQSYNQFNNSSQASDRHWLTKRGWHRPWRTSCQVLPRQIIQIYLLTVVWGWHDSSSALTTLARFSQRWQLKQGRISFFIFIIFFCNCIYQMESSSSLTWDWPSRFKFQQGGDKVGGEKVCQEQVSSPILAFSLLNWLKNSSFNSSWNKLFSRLTAAHFQKKIVRPKLSPHCPPTMYKVCGLLPFERIYGRALTVLAHPPPYALLLPPASLEDL